MGARRRVLGAGFGLLGTTLPASPPPPVCAASRPLRRGAATPSVPPRPMPSPRLPARCTRGCPWSTCTPTRCCGAGTCCAGPARGHVDLPRLQEANVALQVFDAVTQVPVGLNFERNDPAATSSRCSPSPRAGRRAPGPAGCERARYAADRLHRLRRAIRRRAAGGPHRRRPGRAARRAAAGRPRASSGALLGDRGVARAGRSAGEPRRAVRRRIPDDRAAALLRQRRRRLGARLERRRAHPVRAGAGRAGPGPAGSLVDVAHSSPAVVDDVLAIATAPGPRLPHRAARHLRQPAQPVRRARPRRSPRPAG